jgi:hypothetical protein
MRYALLWVVLLAPAGTAGLDKYIAAQEALAADDLGKARTALEDFAKAAGGQVGKLASAAASAKDIGAMRAAFKPLSEAVAKGDLPAGVVVASCPMYKGGSRWVQKDGEIKNPYYGSEMPTCGSIEKKK